MIINAISVEPKRRAEIKRISTETGMIEAELDARHYEIVYPFANEKRVAVIKDEFASLDGKPFNIAFYSDKTEENVETILQGKLLIVGVTEDSFRDLEPEEVEHFSNGSNCLKISLCRRENFALSSLTPRRGKKRKMINLKTSI